MRVAFTRVAIAAFVALGLAFLRMVWHAAVLSPRHLEVAPLDTAPVDAERVARALGRTIRHQTISRSREAPAAAEAFEALHAELSALFPRVHTTLERERVGDWSLLYTWRGSDPELAPIDAEVGRGLLLLDDAKRPGAGGGALCRRPTHPADARLEHRGPKGPGTQIARHDPLGDPGNRRVQPAKRRGVDPLLDRKRL